MSGVLTRVGVVVTALLLALYLGATGYLGAVLLLSGDPYNAVAGAALLVLGLLGAAFIGAELVFGLRAARLARRMEDEGLLPEEQLPSRPSGRIDRAAADAAFPLYRRAVEEQPADWAAWYRLALAYDAAGDRRRARWAARRAIRLERAA